MPTCPTKVALSLRDRKAVRRATDRNFPAVERFKPSGSPVAERQGYVGRIVCVAALVAILIASAEPVRAWNDTGHLVIARIAYLRLSDKQRQAVFQRLRHHPHFDSYFQEHRPAGTSEVEWAFARAATWSDFVRPPKDFTGDAAAHPVYKFHRGPWHYINFPYHAGQRETALPREPLPNPTNILAQLELSRDVLRGKTTHDAGAVHGLSSDANQAVRLCWLFHLVGDLHQPLHVTALIDEKLFPTGDHGDQGGNKLAIRPDASSMPLNLHAYWDGLLGSDSRFAAVRDLAEQLTHDPALSPSQLPEYAEHTSFKSWAAESYLAAKTNAYLDGHLPKVQWSDVEHHAVTIDKVPYLSETDAAKARQVARRRVTLAGQRLAETLKTLGN
ncbi:MAG TPA: S1/P1 nuclease [Planctomycetaceae bacterium]|nr:S1/P1 nuclease [Planctomycetaceae bacterium]